MVNETKKAFLRRLRRALFWRLPGEEARTIVEDYSGFFDDRMAEGKTEAEVYREFGAPTEVARAIQRECGRRSQPLGLLIIVWVLLAGFLNWWWTWQTFRFSNSGYFWFYVAEFLLIPVLWLCWRKELEGRKGNLPHPGRWRIAAFGIPAAVWAVFYGYYAWCILVFVPQFQVFPFDVETAGAKVGVIIGTLKEWGSLLVLAVLALLLVRAWREGSPRPLIGAAWCVGCLCSMSRLYVYSTWLDVMPFSPHSTLLIPLAALLIVGLGSAALTALLIRKGATMDAQLKRGALELCLLADVAKQEQYGYDIIRRLRQSFPDVEESSFYAILRRLHREGALEQFAGETSGGPPRKYYRVTPQGRKKLEEQTVDWRTLVTIVAQHLESL